MKKYLITTTLLDGYDWFVKAPSSWKKRAFDDLMNTLNCAPFNPTPQIQRGIDFERKVNNLVYGTREAFVDQMGLNCSIFYDLCKGAMQQKKLRKEITIDGFTYILYGKADYSKPTVTIDAKTTANYSKGRAKYLEHTQHLLYAYMDDKPDFTYIVAVFNDKEGHPLSVKPEFVDAFDVTVDLKEAEQEIIKRIRACISFIRNDSDIKKAYLERFNWK